MECIKHRDRWIAHLIAIPLIYWFFVPAVIFDITLEIFHRIAFILMRIPHVKRSHYIRVDRHKLRYLKLPQKINCAYCGYVNGLAAYFVRIAGDTEKYWCGIRHEPKGDYNEPSHHIGFLPYDDEESFKEFLKK